MPTKLPTRALGKDGPQVPALGFGLMGLSSFYGVPPPDEERFKLLDRAYELGCTHWDSAQLYGDSEELLGKWFRRTGKRKEIFLATKFGNHVTPEGSREIRNDADYIRMAVAESLQRLQTDYIDLLYWFVLPSVACEEAHEAALTRTFSHRISGKTPAEDIVATMKEFVDSGKVKYLGFSECGPDTLRRANKIHQIHAYQIEYSPFSMDIERAEPGLLQTCRELGIATVAYSPLGRGMLTGIYKSIDDFDKNDFRRTVPRFSRENFSKNLQLVDTLKAISDRKNCTSGQLTLAWMMEQGVDIFPIPGTKRIEYLEENLGAYKVSLTPDENKEIRDAIEHAEVHGTRYAEALMQFLVVDTPPLKK
ncbi:putative pyridoxine 4-dehydrogenase [Microsporum canis]|uniref:Aldo/keto reductase n=1 Tax=Arthroderma otae (strain ATCC MYA-4605 / CBS 113480) TaxID=554155 RepID=C5G0I9_ARTOC|nr:aldo/keto reductase [Microsporum canis CBS 113480]EEQ35642.1 aldo/keto reductase [Microsporum canis CBS 113480]